MGFKIWDRLTQADNIYQSMRPLMYISLIGLAPFRMRSEKEVQTSAAGLVIGFVHFGFYALCFGLSLMEGNSIIGYFFRTNITEVGDWTLRLTGVVAMLTIFGFAIFKRDSLIRIIQMNIMVDEIFVRIGLKLEYRKILWFSFVISVGMVAFNLGYLFVSYLLLISSCNTPSFVMFTTFALPHINTTIMVFKFMCTTHLTKNRFLMLNEILHGMLLQIVEERHLSDVSPFPSVMYNKNRESQHYQINSLIHQNRQQCLKLISNIHDILCDICLIIEEYFTYPLLTIITISFLFILFDDYYILEVMLNPNRLAYFEANEFFAFFIIQMVWYVLIILAIVEKSSSTIKESRQSGILISKLLNATDEPEVHERLVRLSMQLTHRKVNFTAAGLFNLDRTLIFTISGAATCYLIILIQFRSPTIYPDESPHPNCTANYF